MTEYAVRDAAVKQCNEVEVEVRFDVQSQRRESTPFSMHSHLPIYYVMKGFTMCAILSLSRQLVNCLCCVLEHRFHH